MNTQESDDKRTSLDLEDVESPEESSTLQTPTHRRPRAKHHYTQTAKMVATEVRDMIATAYRGEVQSMIRWRDIWKKVGDACEAIAKCLAGGGAVLAFASSSIRDTRTADILSFASGSVGTLGLVLMTYSAYASRESRQRTMELNNILDSIGVTPLPNISNGRTEDV